MHMHTTIVVSACRCANLFVGENKEAGPATIGRSVFVGTCKQLYMWLLQHFARFFDALPG